MVKGTVKFYNVKKAFGFIAGEDGKDYFVHASGMEPGTKLFENNLVEFETEEGDKGPKAVNVKRLDDGDKPPAAEPSEETSEESSEDEAQEAEEPEAEEPEAE